MSSWTKIALPAWDYFHCIGPWRIDSRKTGNNHLNSPLHLSRLAHIQECIRNSSLSIRNITTSIIGMLCHFNRVEQYHSTHRCIILNIVLSHLRHRLMSPKQQSLNQSESEVRIQCKVVPNCQQLYKLPAMVLCLYRRFNAVQHLPSSAPLEDHPSTSKTTKT